MTPLVHTVESIVSSHGTRFEVWICTQHSVVGTADSILIREVHVLVCLLVRFHFNILYSSGTVVGATECVWPGIRALGSSENTSELLIDACQEGR